MRKFAKYDVSWLNVSVKNAGINIKEKLISRYLEKETEKQVPKSTDINVLLNRVKFDRKQEVKKKFYFSAAASTGLILFGLIIFS